MPTLLTHDGVQEANVVIAMGCGETCPVFPGKQYEDWSVANPKGQDLETVRAIVDDVEARAFDLLARLSRTAPLVLDLQVIEPLLACSASTSGYVVPPLGVEPSSEA